MTTVKNAYQELLTLARSALLHESEKQKWVFTSSDTYQYFRDFATNQQAKTTASPPPSRKQQSQKQQNLTTQHVSTPLVTPKPSETPTVESEQVASKSVEKIKPEPKSTPVEPVTKQNEPFKLDPLAATTPHDLSDIKKIIIERFPAQTILDKIPDDTVAKRISQLSKVDQRPLSIVILSFTRTPSETIFLNNLANALSVCVGSARVVSAENIEKQKAWNKLLESKSVKLIIAEDYGLYAYQELMQHHQFDKDVARHYLGDKPLLMLSDIESYQAHPHLKKALWKAIQQQYDAEI